ncbi:MULTISPECIES: anti-phage ATPase IteA [Burkholderia]|uniref:anti-phage ATPase IteA n=1 Tax=Burkholderia TaxID=32008 RepID=UPI000982C67C|nr:MULTISPECIES: anti-phage ATPase IteA [Burkholderia]AQQ38044.1 AAA family ATPase [Burkholderia cenocepacia]ONV25226.1 AAA family ATPase [Burkholderia cenocepacia]ONV25970.1 AAA family ATPase [Burkholderia cenocepacia]ONV37389.1 AAA family ATPase [Burkholderia cenocepacia]ONV38836.1 AAA family ATPase [Burkholderia cenocepacia]
MENISEVLKILDGALRSNASMATSYAGLLADKLEQAGERQQARLIRERLARAPSALASAQDAADGISFNSLPVDGESRLHTVDVSKPEVDSTALMVPDAIESRLADFLANVEHYEDLLRARAALPSRLLLYGPPGTGKTQTARWIAARLNLPLLTVRCDTLISSLLGQTSRNLRRVMDYAEQSTSVLFLDEFDALAGARGNERDVGELQRVVISLLQNIDALSANTILVAATNHEQLLDPAVWRRFSFRIPMSLPDAPMREKLWRHLLADYAPKDLSWKVLVECSNDASGALIEQVCLDAKRSAVIAGQTTVDQLQVFRRLGLALALVQGKILNTKNQEIAYLREWCRTIFSLRALAAVYSSSTRQVSTILNGEYTDGTTQKHPKSEGTKAKD